MDTKTTVEKRRFDLLNISEKEGAVLCALTSMSDDALTAQIETEFMAGETTIDEAIRIGKDLRGTIHIMMWGC